MRIRDQKPYHIDELPDLEVKIRTGDDIIWIVNIKEKIQEIQGWCQHNNCGKRMSFDVFRFDTPEQKTMFMLRWAV
jgi:hypothetical protein